MPGKRTPERVARHCDRISTQLSDLIAGLQLHEEAGYDLSGLIEALQDAEQVAEAHAEDLRSPMRCDCCGHPRGAPHRFERCTATGESYTRKETA